MSNLTLNIKLSRFFNFKTSLLTQFRLVTKYTSLIWFLSTMVAHILL